MIALLLLILLADGPAAARDDGRYAQVDRSIRDWFRGLTNQRGVNCCDTIDGIRLEDPDWELTGDGYRVRLDGVWLDVPAIAVITKPNRVGYVIVWRVFDGGKPVIRCFLPGAGL
jgi:hypothetical protein